ncbi:MAG: hypothetical protein WD100_09055 [Tistlia sp.]|uniref:hypothetical protein n=1 Tax=Tistlia sp. TaxID=3057121 RepID=UPI0034A1C4FC
MLPLPPLRALALTALLAFVGAAVSTGQASASSQDSPPALAAPERPTSDSAGEEGVGAGLVESLRKGLDRLTEAGEEAAPESSRNRGVMDEFYDELLRSAERLGETGAAVLDHGKRRLDEALDRLLDRLDRDREHGAAGPQIEET